MKAECLTKCAQTNKMTLCYSGHPLGILEKTDNGYRYSSNIEIEQDLKDRGVLMHSEYSLWYSVKRENKKLFPEFVTIINNCRRQDIMEQAGIIPQDSMWGKLVKLSRLSWFPQGFYVRQDVE